MAWQTHDGLELGRTKETRRKQAIGVARYAVLAVLFFTSLVVAAFWWQHKSMGDLTRAISRAMDERSSVCLSSYHVGDTETRVMVVRGGAGDMVMLNPREFQTFGREVLTQEIAHRPTHCAFGSSASYQIGRTRRESITVSYVPVNMSDWLWPAESMMPQATVERTFAGPESLCLQHCLEVLAQRNPCEQLPDAPPQPRAWGAREEL